LNIVEEAFQQLYLQKDLGYDTSIKYSSKFKPYNSNVRLYNNRLEFNLSRKWKPVSREIQIGLIQSLLLKILRNRLKPLKKTTQDIELYNIFIKKIHIAVPKTKSDPLLEESFNRVNERYFYGLIEKPNLAWHNSISKLGSYEYGSDTISISGIFKNANKELLDYIMYHEMLHKKHKFKNKNGRNYHHTTDFRKKEKEFENQKYTEEEIKKLIRRIRRKLIFNRVFI